MWYVSEKTEVGTMHSIDLIPKENWRHDNDDLLSKILEKSRVAIPYNFYTVQFDYFDKLSH